MVGRRSFRREARRLGAGGALALALMLGASAPALASEEPRLVMVEHSPAMIEALEGKGYDVGFVGEHYEAGVYVDDIGEARLRAEGYKIGETLEDEGNWLARKARDRRRRPPPRRSPALVAKNGLTKSAKAKGAVEHPGRDRDHARRTRSRTTPGASSTSRRTTRRTTATSGPVLSLSYAGPDGVFRPAVNLSNSARPTLPTRTTTTAFCLTATTAASSRGPAAARAARPSASRATS